MKGLIEHLELLNIVEYSLKAAETVTIKGLSTLDVSETRGKVHVRFNCPDKKCPMLSYNIEVQVTKEFYDKNIKKMLEIKNV
jgi:hypothetical protein